MRVKGWHPLRQRMRAGKLPMGLYLAIGRIEPQRLIVGGDRFINSLEVAQCPALGMPGIRRCRFERECGIRQGESLFVPSLLIANVATKAKTLFGNSERHTVAITLMKTDLRDCSWHFR